MKNVVEPRTSPPPPPPQEVLLRLNVSGRTAKQETSTQTFKPNKPRPLATDPASTVDSCSSMKGKEEEKDDGWTDGRMDGCRTDTLPAGGGEQPRSSRR